MKAPLYSYLRLSVTDRCNFNCFYCNPALRQDYLNEEEKLTDPQMLLLVKIFCEYGIKHVRITGGEPLLRDGLSIAIKGLRALPQVECLSLTTNGCDLSEFLEKNRGIRFDKVNISLDTLRRERFKKLTGTDAVLKVKEGVMAAKKAGIKQVKLNVILMKGFNDDEISDFVDFGLNKQVDVRFIEYFSTNFKCDNLSASFIPSSVAKDIIEEKYGALEFLGPDPDAGPAQYFRIKTGAAARIGFISSVTDFFCRACNRLRLTCDGKLYPCLHSDYRVDFKEALTENDSKNIRKLIEEVFSQKRSYNKAYCARSFEMSSIGG